MVEPRIQYAKTEDGVSIAYWKVGKGLPLVMTGAVAGALSDAPLPEYAAFLEGLASKFEVVRYDHRGFGLSDRAVADYSLHALVRDLEAVVSRLTCDSFHLFSGFQLGPVAIAFAARHPERVSRLLLWCTWAQGTSAYRSPIARAVVALRDSEWEDFTEASTRLLIGEPEGDTVRRIASGMRNYVTREGWLAFAEAARQYDVADVLSEVQAPTLVLHRRQARFPELETARDLTSRIPEARLVVLEGQSVVPAVGDVEPLLAAINDFLGEGEEPPPALAKEDVHTILFTDVEASTSLTQRLGDEKARDILRSHERIVREALRSHGGSEVKTMGDGFMASFSSATRALECAIAIQRSFQEHNEAEEEPIHVRVGLNAGEPIAEEEDLFGTAVIVAARIAAKAAGGEILAANVVRELAAGKGFLFSDRGDTALRGFQDPVRLFEVRWREEG